MAGINPLEVAEKALKMFSFVHDNKAFKNIRKELNEAFSNEVLLLWDKVKGWFIKKDPNIAEILKKYEEKPEDADARAEVKAELRRLDAQDLSALAQDLERMQLTYFEIVNKIGTVEGEENIIRQDGTGRTHNEVGRVIGNRNQIYQGSSNDPKPTDPED